MSEYIGLKFKKSYNCYTVSVLAQESKIEKSTVESELTKKVDKDDLERKISRNYFDDNMSSLDYTIQELMTKLDGHVSARNFFACIWPLAGI